MLQVFLILVALHVAWSFSVALCTVASAMALAGASAPPQASLPNNFEGAEEWFEGDRLTHNILLLRYPDNLQDMQREVLRHPTLWGIDKEVYGVCLQKGTHRDHIGAYHVEIVDQDDVEWVRDWCDRVEVVITSFHYEPLFVYWHDHFVAQVKPGEKHTAYLTWYVGDYMMVRFPNGTVLDQQVIDTNYTRVYAPHGFELHQSFVKPNDVHHSLDILAHTEARRVEQVQYYFTSVGFKKATIPLDIWAMLSQFYHNNNRDDARFRENWANKGLYVNYYETKRWPDMIVPGFGFKQEMYRRIIPLLEEWIGHTHRLESTDIYGIRTYYRGAVLQPHVDRTETHAVSLIINLAQDAVQRPWQVNIRDHSGRLHNITMQPGEWVYYESASCLHSRVEPLDGTSYTNIFVHTRPMSNPDWYKDVDGHGYSTHEDRQEL